MPAYQQTVEISATGDGDSSQSRDRYQSGSAGRPPRWGKSDRIVCQMKPAMPHVVRVGALIRVAGSPEGEEGIRAMALSMVDLKFSSGHVERWLGPGELTSESVAAPEALVAWGCRVWEEQSVALRGELRMSFDDVTSEVFEDAPIEIVIEWGGEMNLPSTARQPWL
jgi:hypothetical protein